MVTLEDVVAAQRVIEGRLHRTPLVGSAALGARIGAPLFFKRKAGKRPARLSHAAC